MQHPSRLQIYIPILLFITINVLFYFKYVSRVSSIAAVISIILYTGFTVLLFKRYFSNKLLLPNKKLLIPLIILYIFSCITILLFIPKESLNADRYEMIELFWNTTLSGQYPYGIASPGGNYPGPMPFYFILCYPFYVIGEIGYIALTGILIWFYYIYKTASFRFLVLNIFLLFSSMAMYWEVFARSTVFFNTVLFVIFFFSLRNFKNKIGLPFYLSAIAGGLLFSTRNIFVLVLIPWVVYLLYRENIKFLKLFRWGLVFAAAFILSFLPFVLMDPGEFLRMNPFLIQSTFLMPFGLVLFFILISFVAGFFCRKFDDVIFASGILLFLTVSGHVIYAVITGGIDSYMHAGADISYYIFCFPFLLKSIADNND